MSDPCILVVTSRCGFAAWSDEARGVSACVAARFYNGFLSEDRGKRIGPFDVPSHRPLR
jgi:hypothetical protein